MGRTEVLKSGIMARHSGFFFGRGGCSSFWERNELHSHELPQSVHRPFASHQKYLGVTSIEASNATSVEVGAALYDPADERHAAKGRSLTLVGDTGCWAVSSIGGITLSPRHLTRPSFRAGAVRPN